MLKFNDKYDMVIFSVKETTGVIDFENVIVYKQEDIFTDGKEIGGELIAFDCDDDELYETAVGFGIKKVIDPASDIFIVTSKKITTIDDEYAYIFTGMQAGEEISITVYDKAEDYTCDPSWVSRGDILLLSDTDSNGYVRDIEVLLDYYSEKECYPSFATEADKIYSGFGIVTYSGSNGFAINDDIVNDYDASVYVEAEESISYKTTATYTLLDYTEGTNPEVSIKNGSKSLFNVDMYESYAYVRFVDGRLKEVVVYRVGITEW